MMDSEASQQRRLLIRGAGANPLLPTPTKKNLQSSEATSRVHRKAKKGREARHGISMLLGCQQGLLHRAILAMDMVRTRKTKTSMRRGHFVLLKLFACSCSTLFFSVVAGSTTAAIEHSNASQL